MFTLLVYTGVCLIVAAILTVLCMMFRPIHKRGESKSWSLAFFFFLMCFSAPYIYTEGLTKLYGDKMKGAIVQAYDSCEIQGPMHFFRVTSFSKTDAKAIVIGSEKESWGGTDRPVLSVHLVKDGEGWKADSYKIVSCDRLNKDGVVFPPYW